MGRFCDLVGIELEGGWDKEPPARMKGDGSVTVSCDYQDGEIASHPFDAYDRRRIKMFLNENYPHKVNETCGMHIHVSLRNKIDYTRLMNRRFYEHFLERFTEWGKANLPETHRFWQRMEGVEYSENTYDAEQQVLDRGQRYCHLNYAWAAHKTIECRMLPMFHPRDIGFAIDASRVLVDTFDSFLSTLAPKSKERVVVQHTEEDMPIFDVNMQNIKDGKMVSIPKHVIT
jgi:hypothetical protein